MSSVTSRNYPIRPDHIDTNQHFWDAFGNHEAEVSAKRIVIICQERGQGWKRLKQDDVERVGPGFTNLLRDGHIQHGKDGRYYIMHSFVSRCFAASPRLGEVS